MKLLNIIVMLCIGCNAANAQSSFTQRLQQSKQGEGKVTVTQDKSIDDLVNGPKVTTTPQTTSQTTPQSQPQHKDPKDPAKNKPDTSLQHPAAPTPNTQHVTPVVPDTTAIIPPDDGRKKIMKGYKVNGFRVQVYAGGNSRANRVTAERTGREIKALFPGTPVYIHFYSPRWICRMGNYRTIEEASEVLREVKKLGYSSAIIVKGKITVPYQSVDQPEGQQQ